MRGALLISAIVTVLALPLCARAAVVYEVVDLGTVGGDYSAAYSINDTGQIVGWAGYIPGSWDKHATLFEPTGTGNNIDLGTLGGTESQAWSINNVGQIVGYARNDADRERATLFDPTGAGNNVDLGTSGGDASWAQCVNDAGQIVGGAGNSQDQGRATLFDPTGAGSNTDLGTLGGDWSWAMAINNVGQIVGYARNDADRERATLFDPTGAGNNIDLGTLGGHASRAVSINDAGRIVGMAQYAPQEQQYHATLFDAAGAGNNVDLGTLGGDSSGANSINDAGQIVGWADYGPEPWEYHATLFDPTGAGSNVDLNSLIDPAGGWTLLVAIDINNSGWIVGQGINQAEGKLHAFLLVPLSTKYSGGSGTAENPYQIATAEDLITLGETPEDYDKHFIMTADIDLDPNLPGRKVFDRAVIAPDVNDVDDDYQGTSFNGVFDGNGHKIVGLTIAGKDYVGLFGRVRSWFGLGKVRDLGVVNATVTGSGHVGCLAGVVQGNVYACYSTGTVSGTGHVGGLVGTNYLHSISTSYSTCTVAGESRVGGLVGCIDKGDVTACSSAASVTGNRFVGGLAGANISYGMITASYSTGRASGDTSVGGLVGLMMTLDSAASGKWIPTVTDCYSTTTVIGGTTVGGLVGESMKGSITTSYSMGTVSGVRAVGGLVGSSLYSNEITDSYWDIQAGNEPNMCGNPDGPGCDNAYGKTTAEMKQQSTFEGWDFINVWGMGENQTYPYLRKYSAADVNQDGVVDWLDFAILADLWMEQAYP